MLASVWSTYGNFGLANPSTGEEVSLSMIVSNASWQAGDHRSAKGSLGLKYPPGQGVAFLSFLYGG